MKYYLIVGEASGDLHASNLMRALKEKDPGARFRFYGGELMAAQGGELVRHYREMAYMGFIPVMMHLPAILKGMRECKGDVVAWKPDVLILVDYPGFNSIRLLLRYSLNFSYPKKGRMTGNTFSRSLVLLRLFM